MHRPDVVNGVRVPTEATPAELRMLIAGRAPRGAAFEALARHPDTEALAILVDASASHDAHVRRLAVEAIGQRADGREAARTVVALLADSEPFVVRSACDAAASLKLAEAQDAILRWARAGDPSTREVAVRASPTATR